MSDEQYWDNISSIYEKLYSSAWSKYEDDTLAEHIRRIVQPLKRRRTLDLGCGTGLGYDVLSPLGKLEYTGVDISSKMLAKLQERHPEVRAIHSSADAFEKYFAGEFFDCIICLNVAASFFSDCSSVLRSASDLLSEEGIIYFSFLNRYSLRRLMRFKFGQGERYRTRGDNRETQFVKAITYVKSNIVELCQTAGLKIQKIGYRSILGGVLEYRCMIPIERILQTNIGQLGHEIYCVCEKNEKRQ